MKFSYLAAYAAILATVSAQVLENDIGMKDVLDKIEELVDPTVKTSDERDGNEPSPDQNQVTENDTPQENPEASIELPEPLTMETFDKSVSEQLSFVEFFSPYCIHCKQLAPIWEKAYKEFYPELLELNVQMRQVNCIESGDLCEREDITLFPILRIYAPVRDRKTGSKMGSLKFATLFPRSLVRTEENFKKFIRNAVAEYNIGSIDLPSASMPLSLDQALKLIAGEAEKPELVMFYPGSEKQWEMTDKTGRSAFAKNCYDCLDNKKLWDKVSNQVLTIAATSHFSCSSNKDLCEQLGYNQLTGQGNPTPKIVMFLPQSAGTIRFEYKGELTLDAIKKFTEDLYENHQYENLSAKTLSEIMEFRKALPLEPLQQYYPLQNKVSIVFYHDPKSVSDEDKAILPYLLEYVTYSPFNLHLYVARSDKFERAINVQATNLLEFINYEDNSDPKPFNKALHLATTLTTKPTLFVIKDNTLFTPVFQSYAPEDIRSKEKVLDFVRKHQYPLYQELTEELYPFYFGPESTAEKIVVTFIDSTDAKKTDQIFYDLSLAAHEYHYTKKEYYFNDILDKRQHKEQIVEALKMQNADSVTIIKAMRKEIPHLFDESQVLFTFVDLSNNREFADKLGWNINLREYQQGDTIIVSKDNSYYWDTDLNGVSLTLKPRQLKQVLNYFLDPALVATPPTLFVENLIGSPYGPSLRFMDSVHKRGFFAYAFIFCAILALFIKVTKSTKARRNGQSSGIIGANGGKHD